MTPAEIEVLLHYYYSADPSPRLHAPIVQSSIKMFVFNGMLKEGGSAGYETTSRGKALVKMLCLTPYPEREVRWIDPRTGKDIPE
jgi:hypothetical protein